MPQAKWVLLGLLIVAFGGCSRTNQQTEQPKQQASAPQPAVQPAPPPPAPESTPQVEQQPSPEKTAPVEPVKRVYKAQTEKKEQTQRVAANPRNRRETEPAAPAPEMEITAPPAPAAAPPAAGLLDSTPPAPPRPPEPIYATIPGGSKLYIRLQSPLDSGVNKSGDTFQAVLDQDIAIDGRTVAPRGSVLQGKLSQVAQSGRVEGRASMSLQLVSLVIGSQTYSIQTDIQSFEAESTKKQDATKVGLGAGIGAVIGAIAGGGKGAAIGAAVGGGAGGATVIATRGKDVQFEAEHKFTFSLNRDISVKLQ